MFNKKGLLAAGLSTAMIAASLAGCSSTVSSSNSSNESSTSESTSDSVTSSTEDAGSVEETTVDAASETIAPTYTVESGKVLDFEDGNYAFLTQNLANVAADEATLEIADFNGSKALKVSPNSTKGGRVFELGLDLNAILGDKVTEVATISMQIGLEASDGEFYSCTGTVKANSVDSTTWSTYIEKKNPNEVSLELSTSYSADDENVLVITKDTNSGNNCDNAYDKTGEYSTMYIDNIVFLDSSKQPIEVDSTVTFAAENYGNVDWSNLIEVKDQEIIEDFSVQNGSAWSQYAQLQNLVTTQALDEDGNPQVDENGDPVYNTSGQYDWASIIKPGLVLTIYFDATVSGTNDDGTEKVLSDHPLWLVTGDWSTDPVAEWGWARLCYDSTNNEGTDHYKYNDSMTICQITYDDIVAGFEELSASKGTGMTFEELDISKRSFMFQLESSADVWNVSCVTYAYTE